MDDCVLNIHGPRWQERYGVTTNAIRKLIFLLTRTTTLQEMVL